MGKGVFVVGTGTDVGKTYVSALLAKAMKKHGSSAYFKAAMSGNVKTDGKLIPGDAAYVKKTAGIEQSMEEMCPYVYENAYSPHLAAKIEGNAVNLERIAACYRALERKFDHVTAEGSGGIVCPLRYDGYELYLTDVIRALGLPCVIVADAGLGAINAVALTAEYMRARDLKVNAIVLNKFIDGDEVCEDNAVMIEKLTGINEIVRVQPDARDLTADPRFLYG